MNEKIDFVVTWLDSNDPLWQGQYKKYKFQGKDGGEEEARFRDWGFFKYWFRAVETYAPWVNRVFLVTNGKFPDWINEKHPKLVLVKHSDYIPEEHLPTFNSCTIELHMNRIPGLSEHFVYFNDDCFLLRPRTPEDYFKKGLPCDCNIETAFNVPIYSEEDRFSINMSMLANIGVINRNFNRWETVRQSPKRWIGLHLGLREKILCLYLGRQGKFSGFKWRHYEQPFLKSVMDEAWEKEAKILNNSCTRFREEVILNPYFFRYWQFASNKFYPIKLDTEHAVALRKHNIVKIKNIFKNKTLTSICLNDSPYCTHLEFEQIRDTIKDILDNNYPQKSSFEI